MGDEIEINTSIEGDTSAVVQGCLTEMDNDADSDYDSCELDPDGCTVSACSSVAPDISGDYMFCFQHDWTAHAEGAFGIHATGYADDSLIRATIVSGGEVDVQADYIGSPGSGNTPGATALFTAAYVDGLMEIKIPFHVSRTSTMNLAAEMTLAETTDSTSHSTSISWTIGTICEGAMNLGVTANSPSDTDSDTCCVVEGDYELVVSVTQLLHQASVSATKSNPHASDAGTFGIEFVIELTFEADDCFEPLASTSTIDIDRDGFSSVEELVTSWLTR